MTVSIKFTEGHWGSSERPPSPFFIPRLHKEWEESWDAVMNQRATKERPIEKPLPIMNRRTDERTEYKKRSFKEKQAVKSMALEFMQKISGQ